MNGPPSGLADAQVLALAGELDPRMVIALHRRIDQALDAGTPGVVLDLGAVTLFGGRTVSVLRGALRRVARREATIAIADTPSHPRRVLERRAIDRLEHYATGAAALLATFPNASGAPPFRAPSSTLTGGVSVPAFSQ